LDNSKQHILVMSSWYPSRIDPHVGNFVQRFAQLLVNDYNVSVIHTVADKKSSKIEVTDTTIEGVRTVLVYYPEKKFKIGRWMQRRKALAKGFQYVEDVDLVFGHVLLPQGLQFIGAKNYYNCPLVVLEHGSYFRKEKRKKFNKIQRTILKRTSRNTQQLLAVSPLLCADMKVVFPTTQIDIVPNFIDTSLFFTKSEKATSFNKFIHISTLDEQTKNPGVLFEGFYRALKLKPNLQLTVLSDQPTALWENWVKTRGIAANVSFLGPCTWAEIGNEMQQHDALIATSHYESFGIVFAEAWSVGLPVFATSVGIAANMPDFLGRNIPQNDSEALAQLMVSFAASDFVFDPKIISEHAAQYHAQSVLKQLQTIFNQQLSNHE
jgi:glycosyltransferase involved in cell wall biosynthesis